MKIPVVHSFVSPSVAPFLFNSLLFSSLFITFLFTQFNPQATASSFTLIVTEDGTKDSGGTWSTWSTWHTPLVFTSCKIKRDTHRNMQLSWSLLFPPISVSSHSIHPRLSMRIPRLDLISNSHSSFLQINCKDTLLLFLPEESPFDLHNNWRENRTNYYSSEYDLLLFVAMIAIFTDFFFNLHLCFMQSKSM